MNDETPDYKIPQTKDALAARALWNDAVTRKDWEAATRAFAAMEAHAGLLESSFDIIMEACGSRMKGAVAATSESPVERVCMATIKLAEKVIDAYTQRDDARGGTT